MYFKVDGNGDCLFASILTQVKYASERDEAGYTLTYLRRQAIMHVIAHMDILFQDLKIDIRYLYGLVDADLGPFSVQSYLTHMSKHRKWGDSVIIKIIASMWGVRIGVLRSDSLSLVTYRCQETFDKMDLLLLYNCNMDSGHYTGILRGGGMC